MTLAPNTLVHNRYHVDRLIGQGGMGAVYKATDERLGHTVALKQMLVSDTNMSKAFEREAKILAGLRHAGLPKVTDYFTYNNEKFLVMEFIEGKDLGEMLEQRGTPFPADEVMGWAEQVLQTLEYLHRQNPPVIHRDIKPQNIKQTTDGQIVLLDFGLAKNIAGQQPGAKQPVSVIGYTAEYAPLEQIQGGTVGAQSDLYALAATLYHLLTGTPPPGSLQRTGSVMNNMPDPLQPAHEVNPLVPTAISAILERALSLQIDKRFATATDMLAAFTAIYQASTGRMHTSQLQPNEDYSTIVVQPQQPATTSGSLSAGTPTKAVQQPAAPPPTPQPQPAQSPSPSSSLPTQSYPPPQQKGKGLPIVIIAVVLVVVLALAGGGAWFVIAGNGDDTGGAAMSATSAPQQVATEIPATAAPSQPTDAPDPTENTATQRAIIDSSNAAQVTELVVWDAQTRGANCVAFSPNGDMLAAGRDDKTVQIWEVSSDLLLNAIDVPSSVNSVAFAPDGESLAIAAGTKVSIYNALDGTLLQTLAGQKGTAYSVAFSSDGTFVAAGSQDTAVRIWQVDDGALQQTLEGHNDIVWSVAFAPNFADIIASGSSDMTTHLWNIPDGSLTDTLEEHTMAVASVAFAPNGQTLAAGSWDDTITLWNPNDGTLLHTLEEHTNSVYSVTFSPDNQLLASGSDDGTVRIWQVDSGELLHTLEGHERSVNSVAFSPDGTIIASGSDDETVRLWGISE